MLPKSIKKATGKPKATAQAKVKKTNTTQEKALEPLKKSKGPNKRIDWAKNHHLTDKIMEYLVPNPAARTLMRFSPGDGKTSTTNGTNLAFHYERLAQIVLVKDESELWKDADLKGLSLSIKNRLEALQTHYGTWKKRLGSTGEGLRDDGDEQGYQNLIDKCQKEFPWYETLKDMWQNHSTLDKSMVVNSRTASNFDLMSGNGNDDEEYNDENYYNAVDGVYEPSESAEEARGENPSEEEGTGGQDEEENEDKNNERVEGDKKKIKKTTYAGLSDVEEVDEGPVKKKLKRDNSKQPEKASKKEEPVRTSQPGSKAKGNSNSGSGKASGSLNNLLDTLKNISEDWMVGLTKIVEKDGDVRLEEAKVIAKKEITLRKMDIEAREKAQDRQMAHEMAMARLRAGVQPQGGHYNPNNGSSSSQMGSLSDKNSVGTDGVGADGYWPGFNQGYP